MSYREEDGQVILSITREDYEWLAFRLGRAANHHGRIRGVKARTLYEDLEFLNRLFEGAPDYVPYDVSYHHEKEK